MTSNPPTLAFLEGFGGGEMLMIVFMVLLLFGGDKLPEFARSAGKLMREFKKATSGVEDEIKRALEEDEQKKKIAPPPAFPAITSAPPANPVAETPAANSIAPPSPAPATPAPTNAPPARPPRMLPSVSDEPPV